MQKRTGFPDERERTKKNPNSKKGGIGKRQERLLDRGTGKEVRKMPHGREKGVERSAAWTITSKTSPTA